MSDVTPGSSLDYTRDQYEKELERLYGGSLVPDSTPAPAAPRPAERATFASSALRLGRAAVHGVGRAANEFSDFVVGTAVGMSKGSGIYKIGRSPEEEAEFLTWWEQDTDKANPLRFNLPEEKETGVYGVVENLAQFGAGFVSASKYLKGVPGLGRWTRGAAAGLLTDTMFFDAHETRLSNLVEQGPEWLRNPVTAYLAADESDSAVEGRLKAGLEGLVLGTTVDVVVAGARALRARRLVAAGKMSAEEGEQIVAEALETAAKAEEGAEGSVVKVTPQEDGTATVTLKGDETATVTLPSPAEAERFAASVEDAVKAEQRPRNTLTAEQVAKVQEIRARIDSGADPADTARLLEGIDFNFSRVLEPDDVKALVNAMSEAVRPVFDAARGYRSWDALKKLADGAIPGLDADATVEATAKLFGDTADLDVRLFSLRKVVWGMAKEVNRLSRLADTDPDNPVRIGELTKALDSLLNATSALAGSKANVARGLASLRAPVEGFVPAGAAHAAVDDAAKAAEDAARAAQQAGEEGGEGAGKGAAAEGGEEAAAKAEPEPRAVDHDNLSHTGPSALLGNGKLARVAPAARESVAGMTPREIRALARQIQWTEGDPDKVIRLLRGAQLAARADVKDSGFWKRLLGFRAEMMLSGPKTQIVNAVNNAVAAFQVPAEFWWGGVRSGNKALRQQGWDVFVGHFLHARESLGVAAKAFRIGDNILDPEMVVDDAGARFASFGSRWLSTVLHLPSRMLLATDEFFKQLTYRSNVRAQSLRLAREQGLAPELIGERLADDMRFAFDLEGGGVNPMALHQARYATFTTSLEHGMGKWLLDGANAHPALRIIFPFVRTPVNVFRFAWERTPLLARWSRRHAEDIAAGGERAAVAKAREELGTLMWSSGASLAYMGMISGNGPSDPALRRQWLDAGNQPYSLRVGGKQISYRRMEPIATPLSIIADFTEIMGEVGEDEASDVMVAVSASIMSSVANKTFLQGMTEFFDAMSSGEPWTVERMRNNLVTSFTPNALRQTNPDELYRETRSLVDELQARVPGWSESLEPRRNLFGEPVVRPPGYFNRSFNPFTSMQAPEDGNVAAELVELGKSIPMPSERLEDSIELTDRALFDNGTGQSPYDRWLELIAKPKAGRSLREDLTARMKSEAWTFYSPGTELHPGGKKYLLASRVVDAHQTRAFYAMLREYPKVREALRTARRDKVRALRGTSSELLEAAQ